MSQRLSGGLDRGFPESCLKSIAFDVAPVLAAVGPKAGLHCAFIHGAGSFGARKKENANRITKKLNWYWGDVSQYTKGCATTWFMDADTVNNGWDSAELQDLACQTALGEDVLRTITINNTVVITHSMGNLLFAGALRAGRCKFNPAGSRWLSIAAPWGGATAVQPLSRICRDQNILNVTITNIANLLGFCNGTRVSAAYLTLVPGYPGLERLIVYARKYIYGAMCGDSPVGLPTIYSVPLLTVGRVLGIPEPHDGLLNLDSCLLTDPNAPWGRTPEYRYYRGRLNHADSSCRNGDGLSVHLKAYDSQPLTWLRKHHDLHQHIGPPLKKRVSEST
mmetsp:Transcript_16417/g.29152  ORF Transcript_16417/g.29152 Transcript_16417/m.29152 type:complete len:335 (-) Transcript_16417:900-1904(-)